MELSHPACNIPMICPYSLIQYYSDSYPVGIKGGKRKLPEREAVAATYISVKLAVKSVACQNKDY